MPKKTIKSISEVLNIVDEKKKKKIPNINPMLGYKIRHGKSKKDRGAIALRGYGTALMSDYEKARIIKQKLQKRKQPKNNLKLIREARVKYMKSKNVFDVRFQ